MTADHLPSAVLITRPKPSLQFSKIILLFVSFGYDLEDACPGRESADFAGAAGLSKTKVVDGRNGPGHHDSISGAASGRTRRTKKSRPIVSVVDGVPSVLGRSSACSARTLRTDLEKRRVRTSAVGPNVVYRETAIRLELGAKWNCQVSAQNVADDPSRQLARRHSVSSIGHNLECREFAPSAAIDPQHLVQTINCNSRDIASQCPIKLL